MSAPVSSQLEQGARIVAQRLSQNGITNVVLTNSSSSASPTCTASSAVAHCTETVTLSTSFVSGTTGSSIVQSITSEVCTTINGCEVTATTAFTTVSTATATPTGDIVCGIDCPECLNPVIKRKNLLPQRDDLESRSLDDPSDYDSKDQYVMEQCE